MYRKYNRKWMAIYLKIYRYYKKKKKIIKIWYQRGINIMVYTDQH